MPALQEPAAADNDDLRPDADPFTVFAAWFEAARAAEPNDPDAMSLATVDSAGLPDVRMVLLKGWSRDGFVFYTNGESAKGRELAANPRAALCLHWKSLRRQVRVRGPVSPVSTAESDAYFDSRSRASRISAIASDQSRPIADRAALERKAQAAGARFEGRDPERPAHWGGWRISPAEIELWRDGAHRLHDRIRFTPDGQGGWSGERLQP